jgi:hypothetical protein
MQQPARLALRISRRVSCWQLLQGSQAWQPQGAAGAASQPQGAGQHGSGQQGAGWQQGAGSQQDTVQHLVLHFLRLNSPALASLSFIKAKPAATTMMAVVQVITRLMFSFSSEDLTYAVKFPLQKDAA